LGLTQLIARLTVHLSVIHTIDNRHGTVFTELVLNENIQRTIVLTKFIFKFFLHDKCWPLPEKWH